MKFNEIANITSGQILTRVEAKKEKETTLQQKAITPKSIVNGAISHSDLTTINLTKEVESTKITQVGDLIIKLSSPYECAIVKNNEDNLVVTSFCAKITLTNTGYSPEFLNAYLNTEYVKNIFKASTQGSTVPLLRVNKIKELQLPDISIEKQEQIAHLWNNNMQKKAILEELLLVNSEMAESIVLTNLEVL